jgi:hypothetical protein
MPRLMSLLSSSCRLVMKLQTIFIERRFGLSMDGRNTLVVLFLRESHLVTIWVSELKELYT